MERNSDLGIFEVLGQDAEKLRRVVVTRGREKKGNQTPREEWGLAFKSFSIGTAHRERNDKKADTHTSGAGKQREGSSGKEASARRVMLRIDAKETVRGGGREMGSFKNEERRTGQKGGGKRL